jgi:putative DNA primase/helicase
MKNRMTGANGHGQAEVEGHVVNSRIQIEDVPIEMKRPHSRIINLEWYANRINIRYGPFISIGKERWHWNDFIWEKTTFDKYRKYAVRIQKEPKSCVATSKIFQMLSDITQATEEVKWQGAVRFDGEDIMISLKNGYLRCNTVLTQLEDPGPKAFVTAQLPVEYDPKATCPTFDYLLKSALPDERDQLLLQCFVGYCLLPDHRFQSVLYCYGPPNSGKSLLMLHGVGSIFGAELMSHVSLDDICKGADSIRNMEHSLLNLATEINSRKLEDSSIFNQIACGEPLNKALKYEKGRRLQFRAKNAFVDNHLPRWERGSEAQARRLRFLHFAQDFSQHPKDGSLEKKVKAEANGIFNWALAGLKQVLTMDQLPMGSSESQFYATKFKVHNNPIANFAKNFLNFDKEAKLETKVFRQLYRHWCEIEGISVKPGTDTTKLLRNEYPHLKWWRTRIKGENCNFLIGSSINKNGEELLQSLQTAPDGV